MKPRFVIWDPGPDLGSLDPGSRENENRHWNHHVHRR